jgi:methyl-accepting chemotaxis protein
MLIRQQAGLVRNLNSVSDTFTSASKQIADGSQTIAQGAIEQSSAMEQLSATIAEINNMAKESMQTATNTLDEVQESGRLMDICIEYMSQMLAAMRRIDEKSQNITKTTKVIDDIAFQTNILALNAAVEAARAGQHGKGFAVVSEEVRNLAAKSAEAAKETATLIESSSMSVEEGNTIVEKVNASLQALAEITRKNAIKIAELQNVLVHQSEAMKGISIGIEQMANVIQQNNATAVESATTSKEMNSHADQLHDMLLTLSHNIDDKISLS